MTSTSSSRKRGPVELAADQVVAGDRHLLGLGVAVEADDLHPVEERPGDRVDHVGRGDEQHPREVEVDLQVVVPERVVLGRVEHLEERRRRVAPEVRPDLVDLVQAGAPGSSSRPRGGPARGGPVGRRHRCGGGRGSRPRRGRRPGPPGRSSARGRGRPTRRARSCPPRAGRPGRGWRPHPGRRPARDPRSACSLRTARCSRIRSFTSSSPSWSSSRMRAASAHVEPVLGLGRPTGSRGRCRATCGSSRSRGSARWCAPGCRPRARPRRGPARAARARRAWPGSRRASPSSPSPSSPSSLRMASSWRRSRNSRWVFSMPSSTSVLIRSRKVRSARVSRAHPSTRRSRASTSSVSETSTFWPRERSGE